MLRIGLFLATNVAIMVVISVVFSLLGLEGILAENGVDLNLQALLIMSTIIGFSGLVHLTVYIQVHGQAQHGRPYY